MDGRVVGQMRDTSYGGQEQRVTRSVTRLVFEVQRCRVFPEQLVCDVLMFPIGSLHGASFSFDTEAITRFASIAS